LNTGLEEFRSTVNEILQHRKEEPKAPEPEYNDDAPYAEDEENEFSEGPARPVRTNVPPVRLHPTIRNLISYAAQNIGAQHALVERIEELQEPITALSGGMILQRILEVLPKPGDPQSWASFIELLPPEQALALRHIQNDIIELPDIDSFMEQACAHAAVDAVKARIDGIKTKIRVGNIAQEEVSRLFAELTELQRLLNGNC
jgi:hypothetical protein